VSSPTNPSRAPETRPAGDPLPVAVIGCGRMGRLHARVFSEMPGVRLVGVCDSNSAAAEAAGEAYGCPAFDGPAALPADLAAVTVAVPTAFHAAVAIPFLERGVACLVEKPLAPSADEARRIVAAAQRSGATVQVGHIERFNPAVRAMDRLGVRPRFIEVTRVSPMTFRSMDVGVVLDVMIHDIDIVLRLADSTPERVDAIGVNVIGPHEDICNARVTFANGCVANLTASRLALKTTRTLRAFSPDAYVSLDYQKKYGIVVRRSGNLDAIREAATRIRAGEVADLSDLNYADLVQVEELEIDDVEPARAQMEAFISAVRDGSRPVVSAEDGLAAVELAARIVAAMPEPNLK
jgi:predicted dehydrogenase